MTASTPGSGDDRVFGGSGDDRINSGSGDDVVRGGSGNDRINSGSGDDRIEGGAGDDVMYGGAGSDIFVFGAGDGADVLFAGVGSDWVDQIELGGEAGNGDLGVFGEDWTVTLDQGSIVSQDADRLQLSNDADGEITLSDGTTINFFDVEEIHW